MARVFESSQPWLPPGETKPMGELPNRTDLGKFGKFDYGYEAGQGARQLALSLLAHAIQKDEYAVMLAEPFSVYLRGWTGDDIRFTRDEVVEWGRQEYRKMERK